MTDQPARLDGLTVLALESRRAVEMAELIRRYGGKPMSAPALRETPLSDSRDALGYVAELEAGGVDVAVIMTGVGLRTLVHAVAAHCSPQRLAAALQKTTIVARGPKPVAALRELGLEPALTVPEPNTWRELLLVLDQHAAIAGKRIAIHEYGITNERLVDELTNRRAVVRRVRIYEWALPDDLTPLHQGIAAVVDGKVDIALFTSATQIYHLFQVAGTIGRLDDTLRAALTRVVLGSIGPVCSDALRDCHLTPDFEPTHPKMGQLVAEAAKVGRALLQAKRDPAPIGRP